MKIFTIFFLLILLSCKGGRKAEDTGAANRPSTDPSFTAFIGANIIDGTGAAPVTNGVLLIGAGRIVSIGTKMDVTLPEHTAVVDLSGKTIIPGIINGHGHVGHTKGIEGGHYSRENVIDNLSVYARYGVTTVVSLGDDRAEAEPLRAVHDRASKQWSRLFIAGEVISGKTPEEALAVVDRNHAMGVDFMKVRVDDNLGTGTKMTEEVYRAVINRSHALGYKIATHIYYLEDARKVLEAGSDLIAHSVRDMPVNEAFVRLIVKKNVGYCPTLTREVSAFVYEDTASFFSDPFFTHEYEGVTIEPLLDPARQLQLKRSTSPQTYKRQLPVAMANLKTLSDAGVPIVFGTDSGVPTRFMGYFEHLEMQMMQDAGLTPMQIIVSASKQAAAYLGLPNLGTLSPGHWADFVVLDADPLKDIRNARKISAVYIGGDEIKR